LHITIEKRYECLIEENSPLSNIQDSCLLYQTFKAAVSSQTFMALSPLSNIHGCCLLSNIHGCCLLYQTFKAIDLKRIEYKHVCIHKQPNIVGGMKTRQ
jgi:hypothetical protein